jgi:deoxyribonucleoside regulator
MREREIIKICYLFFYEGLTQFEIGKMMGVSRFKVGRIIKEARKSGLISITINHPKTDLTEMEVNLAKKYKLKEVITVENKEYDGQSILDQVGMAGANYLSNVIEDHKIFGVTWGMTMSNVANKLPQTNASHIKLVQLGGGLGTIEGFDNLALTMKLGQKLNAVSYVIQAPIYVQSKSIRNSFMKEKQIKNTIDLAKKADLVMYGVGAINRSVLWKSGLLNEDDSRILRELGAVGAICGRFFDKSGDSCWPQLNDRTIGLSLGQIRQIKQKVMVSAGTTKLEAVKAAIRGKIVDVLIVDYETAELLLAATD